MRVIKAEKNKWNAVTALGLGGFTEGFFLDICVIDKLILKMHMEKPKTWNSFIKKKKN